MADGSLDSIRTWAGGALESVDDHESGVCRLDKTSMLSLAREGIANTLRLLGRIKKLTPHDRAPSMGDIVATYLGVPGPCTVRSIHPLAFEVLDSEDTKVGGIAGLGGNLEGDDALKAFLLETIMQKRG